MANWWKLNNGIDGCETETACSNFRASDDGARVLVDTYNCVDINAEFDG